MASVTKHVRMMPPAPAIEPDLKKFIDEVLVPMLVRDALREVAGEIYVACQTSTNAQSEPERVDS